MTTQKQHGHHKHFDAKEELKYLKIDGLPNIVRSKHRVLEILWLSIFISASCACTLLIAFTFIDYFNFEVSTSIRYLHETQSVFPTVTLCNLNPFTTDYAVDLFAQVNIRNFADLAGLPDYVQAYSKMSALQVRMWNKTGSYLTSEQIRPMSDLNDMLISCTFQSFPCNASDFQYVYHPTLQHCYRFNSGFDAQNKPVPLKRVSLEGFTSELALELYAGVPNAMSSKRPQRGFWLMVNNASDYRYLITLSSLFRITPGLGVSASVARSFFTQYKSPWSECTVLEGHELSKPLEDSSFFDQIVHTTESYTRSLCLVYCAQHYINTLFNCTIPNLTIVFDKYANCFGQAGKLANDFFTNNFTQDGFIEANCWPKCPLECDQSTFTNTLAFYKYPPSDLYVNTSLASNAILVARHSNQTDFTQQLANNAVKIEIYYDTLTYIRVDEQPKITWMDLLGVIGGHLHLFLGMSMLSFCELFELVILHLRMMFIKNSAKQSTASASATFSEPT